MNQLPIVHTAGDNWDHNERLLHRHLSEQGDPQKTLNSTRHVSEFEKKGEVSETWYKYSKAAQRPGHPSDQPYKTSEVFTHAKPEELHKKDLPESKEEDHIDPRESPKLRRRELKDSHQKDEGDHKHEKQQKHDKDKKASEKENPSDKSERKESKKGSGDKDVETQGHDFPAAMQEAFHQGSEMLQNAYSAAADATAVVKDAAVSAVQRGASTFGLSNDQEHDDKEFKSSERDKDSQDSQENDQQSRLANFASNAAQYVKDSAVSATQIVRDTTVSAVQMSANALGIGSDDSSEPDKHQDQDQNEPQPSRISQIASDAVQAVKNTAVSAKDATVSVVQKGVSALGLASEDQEHADKENSHRRADDQSEKHSSHRHRSRTLTQ
jgi:hypothetical protein